MTTTNDDKFIMHHSTSSNWVDCPICGEPDMHQEIFNDGNKLIHCVNHGCDSNGGNMDNQKSLVIRCLEDEMFDFRTVSGIARETGLTETTVEQVINNNQNIIRQSIVPNEKGQPLYRLHSRGKPWKEWYAEIRMFITKSI